MRIRHHEGDDQSLRIDPADRQFHIEMEADPRLRLVPDRLVSHVKQGLIVVATSKFRSSLTKNNIIIFSTNAIVQIRAFSICQNCTGSEKWDISARINCGENCGEKR